MSAPSLRVQRGGDAASDRLLVLLHGMGGTGDVWRGVTWALHARGWAGRWVAPDLPGHGGSARLDAYTFEAMAEAVEAAIHADARDAREVIVAGHSLGGVVALALAGPRSDLRVDQVLAASVKVNWTGADLARAKAMAAKAQPVHVTRAEAAERHLKLAGLTEFVRPEDVPDAALRAVDGGWSVAFDSQAFAIGAPDVPALLRASRAPVRMAVGDRDPMCSPAQLAAVLPEAIVLAGMGHNVHVEAPEAFCGMLEASDGSATARSSRSR